MDLEKKLMIPDSEIPKCPEFEVKSKIGKIFKKHNPLEEYSVKIYEIDSYFYKHYEKIQVDKNGIKYILFRIDVYFNEFLLAVEIDEKGHTDRDPIFEEKRQKALEKNLGCKFIRINTSKERYNADYEASRVQEFICKFKGKQLKKTRKKIKQKNKIKIEVDKNGCKCILFRGDVYFTEYLLTVEVDEKGNTDKDLIFEKKRQKAPEKNLGCKFIRINTSKEQYNAD